MESKKVSKNTLKRIITSPDFVDTVEKCVNISEKTGYESSFDIGKKIFGNSTIYSPTIEIGTSYRVGGNSGIERARKNYKEITGIRANIRNIEEDPVFLNYLTSRDPAKLKLDITNYDELFKNPKKAEEYYGLISLHTHPGGDCAPSEADLDVLSWRKSHDLRGGITVSPISIICGIKKNSGKIPLYILQERDPSEDKDFDEFDLERPSPSDNNYKLALEETEAHWDSHSNFDNAISSMIFERPQTRFYNKDLITFDRKKRIVELSSKFNGFSSSTDLSKFEFKEFKE